MSASELIEQLKALSAKEREAFARLFRELEKPASPPSGAGNTASSSANWPDFDARLKRIYGNKVVVDSEAVVSEAVAGKHPNITKQPFGELPAAFRTVTPPQLVAARLIWFTSRPR